MLEDRLNSSKKETSKKDIIIQFDKARAEFADMLKSIISICNNNSDAANFNKKIHVNLYDETKVRDNKNQISENIYEIIIGYPDDKDWCKEQTTPRFGMHVCWVGKTAHIYVEEKHYEKKEIKEFHKYATMVNEEFKEYIIDPNQNDYQESSFALQKPKGQPDEDGYWDVPKIFNKVRHGIAHPFKWAYSKLGFGKQHKVLRQKYQILIMDFYLNYMPKYIGVIDAR